MVSRLPHPLRRQFMAGAPCGSPRPKTQTTSSTLPAADTPSRRSTSARGTGPFTPCQSGLRRHSVVRSTVTWLKAGASVGRSWLAATVAMPEPGIFSLAETSPFTGAMSSGRGPFHPFRSIRMTTSRTSRVGARGCLPAHCPAAPAFASRVQARQRPAEDPSGTDPTPHRLANPLPHPRRIGLRPPAGTRHVHQRLWRVRRDPRCGQSVVAGAVRAKWRAVGARAAAAGTRKQAAAHTARTGRIPNASMAGAIRARPMGARP